MEKFTHNEGSAERIAKGYDAMDYYERLGVPRNASQEEIAKAFRALSKKFHPDASGSDEVMKSISEAYATLKSADGRMEYDRSLPPAPKAPQEEHRPKVRKPDPAGYYKEVSERLKEEARKRSAKRES